LVKGQTLVKDKTEHQLLFFLKGIKVDKSVNVSSSIFQSAIQQALLQAYVTAFNKVSALFVRQSGRTLQSRLLPANLQVVLDSVLPTGLTTADKTKNIVELRYYLLNGNQIVPAQLAADAISKLTPEDMTRILNVEVEEQGYVETQPRTAASTSSSQLWIIAAVLVPVFLLVVIFWVILFIYYKCVNPKRPLASKSKSRIIESPDTVS
jgi:hypothetical protein